jgi:hypothetical protein
MLNVLVIMILHGVIFVAITHKKQISNNIMKESIMENVI